MSFTLLIIGYVLVIFILVMVLLFGIVTKRKIIYIPIGIILIPILIFFIVFCIFEFFMIFRVGPFLENM